MIAPDVLATPLGTNRLLARPGAGRLHLLDPPAALLWEWHAAGLDAAALAARLSQGVGLDPPTAQAQVDDLLTAWDAAGLLAAPAVWHLRLADRVVRLNLTAGDWAADLAPWLGHLRLDPAHPGDADHALTLSGTGDDWRLEGTGLPPRQGTSLDAAQVAVLQALVDTVCQPTARLLVVHGAGLIAPDGGGWLLVAPSGGGKTTLAAALDAAGFGLLSDDVVPVTPAGDLLGFGLPLCLKAGSWPVLRACRPDLDAAAVIERHGQPVRFLPARHPAGGRRVAPTRLVLSHYRPGSAASLEPVSPEWALQGLLGARTVLGTLTQDWLDALARWLERVPAYRLSYPDLASALTVLGGHTTGSAPGLGAARFDLEPPTART